MGNKQEIRENSSVQEEIPFDEEKSEEIAEQIKELIEKENSPAAIELLGNLRPSDQSGVMEELPIEAQQEILTTLPPEEAAEILEHLEPKDVAKVSEGLDSAVLSDILDVTDSDVTADILKQLPEERARHVLEEMGKTEAEEVISLLQYPDDSAGGRMALDYIAVREDATADNALDTLRLRETEVKDIQSIFVISAEEYLVGKLSIARLALARHNTVVRDIMEQDIIYVPGETNQEECARIISHYNLNQLPVVDENRRLLGVIMAKDVIGVIEEEATEDMYKLAGITGERLSGPLYISIRNRLPWLSINLLTTFMAASVIGIFEKTIAQVVTLAMFLPVVAGQGGIGGTQSLTLVVRSMALGDISRRGQYRLLVREILLGMTHGLLLGVAVGIVAFVWKGNYMLGIVLGLAMVGNMVIAGLTGAGIPLLLMRLHIDPAVASAVVVTTCTDIVGFFLFLGLATVLVRFIM